MNEQATASNRTRCTARKADGAPCRNYAQRDGAYCVFHDPTPEGKARSLKARARGGRNRAALTRAMKTLPPDLRTVYDRLAQALAEVHGGKLDANRATAMAALSRAMVSVLDSAETLRRLENIEAMLDGAADPLRALGYGEL